MLKNVVFKTLPLPSQTKRISVGLKTTVKAKSRALWVSLFSLFTSLLSGPANSFPWCRNLVQFPTLLFISGNTYQIMICQVKMQIAQANPVCESAAMYTVYKCVLCAAVDIDLCARLKREEYTFSTSSMLIPLREANRSSPFLIASTGTLPGKPGIVRDSAKARLLFLYKNIIYFQMLKNGLQKIEAFKVHQDTLKTLNMD